MLEVGTNSYVTIEEADNYVGTFYRDSDEESISWRYVSEEDKIVLLMRALISIESLPFVGKRSRASQQLSFPRWPRLLPPQEVRYAQIEEALALNDDDLVSGVKDTVDRLRRGIRSYSIGKFSESFRVHNTINSPVISDKAHQYLTPFLGGGYRI